MTSSPVVAVVGASGHTGRFVVAELQRRGFAPRAIGRDSARLAVAGFEHQRVQIACAAVDDPAALDHALRDAHAVINCAGPFLDTAHAVAAAALRARIHYLDVTAEQPSAQATFEAFDAAARKAGVVVLPAMGFYGGLADLLATATLDDWPDADEIQIGVALDSWHPTAGTRVTGQRNTARRLVIADGRLAPLPQPAPTSSWAFPAPFGEQEMVELPFSEVIVIARHLRTAQLHHHINEAPLRELRDTATPPPKATDASRRSDQRFALHVKARRGNAVREAVVQGRDIYAVTAPLVCEAVQRILGGIGRGGGAFAAGQLFEPRSFLQALAPDPLSVKLDVSNA
jgi:uncharacterized protein YbjT (DUF2867 family)